MKKITVNLAPDHLQSICDKASPLGAIEELIWNALDADATEVRIMLVYSNTGTLARITVNDNGTGFTPKQCKEAFEHLGGSSKTKLTQSAKGRTIHGKLGKGRIKAFKIGKNVTWKSQYKKGKELHEFSISGNYQDLLEFSMTDDKPCSDNINSTGVHVTIDSIESNFATVLNVDAAEKLASKFALYLLKYPGISITYDGMSIAPEPLVEHKATYPVTVSIDGKDFEAELDVIEWKRQVQRALFFCDKDGFSFEETAPGIRAPGFDFTAHLRSDAIKDHFNNGAFLSSGLDPSTKTVLEPVKEVLRSHFRERDSANAQEIIALWKEEKIYPYQNTEKESPIERVERQVFDICALRVHEYVKDFEKTETGNKRMMFRLLQEALTTNPQSVQKILSEVLNLNQEDQDDFAQILERTKLSAVISATRLILDRLDFLDSLDPLLYGKYQKTLKERTQLQNILTEELWVFGEQYALGCTEKNLKNVLVAHLNLLGRDKLVGDDTGDPVTDSEGKERRFDIMLHRTYSGGLPSHFNHLVIELKRPLLTIGKDELSQISEYAFTVSKEDRFDKEKTRWDFVLLGRKLSDYAEAESNPSDRAPGHYKTFHDGKINVYVKTWASIIQEARWRYGFYKDQMQLEALENEGSEDQDTGLSYLRKKYSDLLPPDVA